jgi:ATP-dependent 26S proteasome regulatory subunit
MLNFFDLDKNIQKQVEYQSNQKLDGNLNPFYISNEEITLLLKQESKKHQEVLLRLKTLSNLFNLSNIEQTIILVILAPLLDPKYQKIYAYLQNDLNKKYPTIALISLLISHNEQEYLDILYIFRTKTSLTLFKLIEIEQDGYNFTDAPLKLTSSIEDFLCGFYTIDKQIQKFASIISKTEDITNDLETKTLIKTLQINIEKNQRFLVNFHGKSNFTKENIAKEISYSFGYSILKIDTTMLLEYIQIIDDLFNILYREAILSNTLLYFDNFDSFIIDEKYKILKSTLFKSLDEFSWLTFFSSTTKWNISSISKEHHFLEIPIKNISYNEQINQWKKEFQQIGEVFEQQTYENLAQLFNFTIDEIKEITDILETKKLFGISLNSKIIYQVARDKISLNLNHLAKHTKSSNYFKDIVLPKEQLLQLKNIISHYSNQYSVFEKWGFKKYYQSAGLGVLFTGYPGTGKTMAASIIANELGLDIYTIELSRIISKYIGETEKNLSKIFESAEGSGVILFFDEADAIFGKRTETKDSHDRYANIEVSYLLQKIEEYSGLVILASNFRKNIDDAFIRRMRFIINFPTPDQKMREILWQKVFPEHTPIDKEIDFSHIAQNFPLSGANIRNAALFSAFYATQEKKNVNMEHIIKGLKIELTKIGKTFKSSDFLSK